MVREWRDVIDRVLFALSFWGTAVLIGAVAGLWVFIMGMLLEMWIHGVQQGIGL